MKSLFGTAWRPPQRAVLVPRRWRSARTAPWRVPARDPRKPVNPRQLLNLLKPDSPDLRRPHFVMKQNYQIFQSLAESRFKHILESMGNWAENKEEWRSFGVKSQLDVERQAGLFKATLTEAFELAMAKKKINRQENPLFWNLRNAFIRQETEGLTRELQLAFQTFMMRDRFPEAVNQLHRDLADMRNPYEWYPATRMIQRTIHLHVGPTNSGKTYNALKALENARTGIYAGPLRLLAHEVWNRFTAKNKACALITGEEMRIPSNADTWFHSCTVEMTPLNSRVDVAVIDEIQMIESEDRGWAWTQAFLGVQAKEVHLCGEERAVPLIRELCARIGEQCVVHEYQRLNGLEIAQEGLGNGFTKLRKGDAVVAFSRVGIHQLKAGIEQQTGRRCAVVYGSLPPETRASQAALFNDPNNDYDFLAASDAIGMGLNLEIKRVIFESAYKFDGRAFRPLKVTEIKQIGGRAGRFRTATQEMMGITTMPAPGEVTAFDDEDLGIIQKAFRTEAGPIPTAGLFPPPSIIERFHSYFPPRTPISFVLGRLRELSRISDRFHMCDFTAAMEIAEVLKEYKLRVSDNCIFLNVPIDLRDERQVAALQAFAKCVAELGNGHLLDFDVIDLEVLDAVRPETRSEQANYLRSLESLHQQITMYLWLSYRYQGVFQSQALAFKVKEMVELKITEHLEKLNFVPDLQRLKRQRRRKAAARVQEKQQFWLGENERVLEHDDELTRRLVDARA
ncbi:P-loop containing nucleoside triphosphate hydrolase protein [Chaetomium strumarium]|uniref:RNA helicase n=1 Tax=Chaetomium strumarium TaxID=1170767 RepID=A0AAJ0GVV2_9PEZI|nr:P-loop containing nucleoside triphosphate hydrolase protein [Chaetomium strumarium]